MLLGLIIFTITASCFGSDISSWDNLSKMLLENQSGDLSHEAMLKTKLYEDIVKNAPKQTVLEMTIQQDYPIVMLAGFYALKERYPEDLFEHSVKIVMTSTGSLLELYIPILDYFEEIEWNEEEFVKRFSNITRIPTSKMGNLSIILAYFKFDLLDSWFHSPSRGWSYVAYESLVLSDLFDKYPKNNKEITSKMNTTLTSYAGIPGYPRYLYIFYGSEHDDRYKMSMETVLQDNSLFELHIGVLLQKKSNYINHNINIESLTLSQKRLDLIKRGIERYLK